MRPSARTPLGTSAATDTAHALHNWSVRVSIIGFGLIGGSIARALRERGLRREWHLTAWSRSSAPVRQAVQDGVLDVAAVSLEAALRGADLVILAAPPLACLDLIDQLGSSYRATVGDATITDVASAKTVILARADAARLAFIGGHPMAGRELSGYGAALPDLFEGRPWITVPGVRARLVDAERLGRVIDTCGAIPVPMKAEAHDQAVAAISHMPLVVSAALVEAVAGGPGRPENDEWLPVQALAATGWAGMTRLARGEPAMGAGIAATNSAAIAHRLREFRDYLDQWIALLERQGGPDAEVLRRRFESARDRLSEPVSR